LHSLQDESPGFHLVKQYSFTVPIIKNLFCLRKLNMNLKVIIKNIIIKVFQFIFPIFV
jgi:hypothetical protein